MKETYKHIRGKVDNARHAGARSTRQRLDAAIGKLSDWRREVTFAHQMGEDAPPIPFAGSEELTRTLFYDEYPEGREEEISLWKNEGGTVKGYPKSINQVWDEQESEIERRGDLGNIK